MKADYVLYAFHNLVMRKMRSTLTILSIVIGIAAIYALVSFGQGLSSYVDNLSSTIGKDKLLVQAKGIGAPGTDASFFISKKEIDFLEGVNGIAEITGLYMKTVAVDHDRQLKYVFASGVPVDDHKKLVDETFSLTLDKGRELRNGDKMKAVLGYNYQLPEKIFKRPLTLQDTIMINGQTVSIIGFYESIGNPQDDSNIYMTPETMEFLFPEAKDKFQIGIARADASVDASQLAERAQEKLRKFKDQKKGEEDFYIQTFDQAIATFNTILTVINGALVLIALISLLIAAVNITNTMYTTVLERTKDIGVMKAIGAKNSDIMLLFLTEAGMVGFVGGVLGVVLGYLLASAGGAIAAGAGYSLLKPAFSPLITIGCIFFSVAVGIFAGFMPSYQASKLKPVDALRYE
ncbi:ABC transporter permease [Candidatus Woesearchaeota archaeon]|nr:ABC transporter permease [Candidatus Woesearchaeota archaeon]